MDPVAVAWRGTWESRPAVPYREGHIVYEEDSGLVWVAAAVNPKTAKPGEGTAWRRFALSDLGVGLAALSKGAWDTKTAYQPGDLVSHNNSSYIARRASTGVAPPSAADWALLAAGQKGDKGDPGVKGDPGLGPKRTSMTPPFKKDEVVLIGGSALVTLFDTSLNPLTGDWRPMFTEPHIDPGRWAGRYTKGDQYRGGDVVYWAGGKTNATKIRIAKRDTAATPTDDDTEDWGAYVEADGTKPSIWDQTPTSANWKKGQIALVDNWPWQPRTAGNVSVQFKDWPWRVLTLRGDVGPQGPAGKPGPGLNLRGDWAADTSYGVLDMVTDRGSSYGCIAEHTSRADDEPGQGRDWTRYWKLVAKKGLDDPPTGGVFEFGPVLLKNGEAPGFVGVKATPVGNVTGCEDAGAGGVAMTTAGAWSVSCHMWVNSMAKASVSHTITATLGVIGAGLVPSVLVQSQTTGNATTDSSFVARIGTPISLRVNESVQLWLENDCPYNWSAVVSGRIIVSLVMPETGPPAPDVDDVPAVMEGDGA